MSYSLFVSKKRILWKKWSAYFIYLLFRYLNEMVIITKHGHTICRF